MIPNAEGDLLTPSVVLFTDQEVAVGREARTASTVHPELVVEWVKRDMGLPYYTRAIHGQKLPPEVIQACILRKLKQDVIGKLGSIGSVVITVPAYFDEPRRHRTADAGEMAGLNVLDIVNEPTAAALAFGETLGYLTPSAQPKKEMTVLVYDLGGGTFDVTLLRLAPGKIQTIATDGDVQLGGHDWDMRVVDYVADEFQKSQGLDPRTDPATMNRVLAAVIDAKHALSARSRVPVRVEMQGRSSEVPVTREQFKELTADLLERTAYTTRQVLASAKMEWKDVSRLLLVGGSTRMPMVVEMLRQMSGLEPDHTVNPDEAVARGAALYAAYLQSEKEQGPSGKNLSITNVNSHSLGVEGIDPETLRKTNVVLIPRNTSLPKKVTEKFATKAENQRSIVLQVLEGESSLPSECTSIGRTAIHNLPEGLPKNWPIHVTFEYGSNGRLTVHASVAGTEQSTTLELERSEGMSGEGLAKWKKTIDAGASLDMFEEMVQDVMEGDEDAIPVATRAVPPTSPPKPSPMPVKPTPAKKKVVDDEDDFDAMVQDVLESPQSKEKPLSKVSFSSVPATSSPTPEPKPTVAAAAIAATPEKPVEAIDWTPETAASEQKPDAIAPQSGSSRWIFSLIGHIVAASIGLGLGYLVLHWIRPGRFPLPW
jgi:molecular chaperone DnaK